ncbi:hypothetical protein H2201_009208 [Coniosporium apollinis]|uniref:Uncharacterized protein n=1 Tax=Coniosporium apollinis TaxID=61459 RepID=A0ABQ9NEH6_9PEZI|nr:hypothetical protein H2201_009208 [Coniosporium apollinis]
MGRSYGKKGCMFLNTTGLIKAEIRRVAYPRRYDSIPRNKTIDLQFPGVREGDSIPIKIPCRNYAKSYPDVEADVCQLNVDGSGGLRGAPFAIATFFTADDVAEEIALAQGGVSKAGEGVNPAAVVNYLSSAC